MGEEDHRMNPFLTVLFVLSVVSALIAIRIFKGPTAPDRVVGLDTLNTIVIASMILFGAYTKEVIYIDVGIVYALLSFIATLFIAKYLEGGEF
jgi:multicomponent Na+:H+ antiporter subunit F